MAYALFAVLFVLCPVCNGIGVSKARYKNLLNAIDEILKMVFKNSLLNCDIFNTFHICIH